MKNYLRTGVLLVVLVGLIFCQPVFALTPVERETKIQAHSDFLRSKWFSLYAAMKQLDQENPKKEEIQRTVSDAISDLGYWSKRYAADEDDYALMGFFGLNRALERFANSLSKYLAKGDPVYLDMASVAYDIVSANFQLLDQEEELRCLRFVVQQSSESYLTDKLIKFNFSMTVNRIPGKTVVFSTVDTKTQPSWNHDTSLGRFNVSDREVKVAYQEAGERLYDKIQAHGLPYLSAENVTIAFYIRGSAVGTWTNRTFKLEGEK